MVAVRVMPENWWIITVVPEPETIAQAMRRLRQERGLTQADVGRHIRVSGNMVTKYEGGKDRPPSDSLRALAVFYGLNEDYFFELEYEHDRWARTQLRVPGPSIAIPAEPEIRDLLDAIGPLSPEEIRIIAASAENLSARKHKPAGADERTA